MQHFQPLIDLTWSKRNRARCGTVLTCCLLGFVCPSQGAVINTIATVSSTVQELIDGSPGSVSTDRNEAASGSAALPLVVSANLSSTNLDGTPTALGEALSEFADPSRLDQPNPEEFALEVAGYSNVESVSYSVRGSAIESRTVVFATEGSVVAPVEIDFDSDDTREVESTIFISGAVILWSNEAGKDLTDVSAEFRISVTREDDNSTLFETTLTVTGDGSGQLQQTVEGPIIATDVSLAALLAQGLDPGTASVLESLDRNGTLLILAVPPQEHAYTYTVTADESLVLTASFEARVRSAPQGTGVAAVLGSPFDKLAEFIEAGLPGVTGETVESAINTITEERSVGLVQSQGTQDPNPGVGLCGAFGMEALGLFFAGFTLIPARLRARSSGAKL